jgi:ribonuclease J
MRIIIHRGSHEIGGSCVEIMARDTRIIHDVGMPLVKKNGVRFQIEEYADLDGPELVKAGVLPGSKGFYEWDTAIKAVDAFFLSHAHLDQYGFLKFKKKAIPCYMGESRLIQDRIGAGQSYTKV